MSAVNRALRPGTVIHSRYRVEQVLGAGGFGVTYRVTDLRENRTAAMKEYIPQDIAVRRIGGTGVVPRPGCDAPFEQFRDRFLEEARIIYRYRGHPNIIRVQHLFYENNTAYYVMEFIDGMDFGKYLERSGQRLSWEDIRPVMAQVAAALQEVHGSGMIHCDISPDNIFLLSGGQVKLIDFGAAKSMLHGKSSVMLLKRGFAPPEQLSSQGRLGPWTDIYAMAVTIYRAFTGKMPPTAEERLTSDATIWPSELGIAAPSRQWEQALRKAMSLRVEDRYQDVAAFWAELAGTQAVPELECFRGIYAGTKFQIRGETLLGTDSSRCSILFPPGTPGVSRVHMRVWAEDAQLRVMDMGSSYGTWLNGQRMIPGLAYALAPGMLLVLGDGQVFRAAPPESK
ncbi:MAG: FHA domain-containing serine/threonine-protein kinase [Eubacteriales bacterium]|nr:FHA domain-containing serine/threonine-protein kinase [Eubacteriales bacterium]